MSKLSGKDNNGSIIFPELVDSALIREVHTYGTMVQTTESFTSTQNTGLGKSMITKAEQIALNHGYSKIAVISGVGARNYYRKLGYEISGKYGYMTKKLRFDISRIIKTLLLFIVIIILFYIASKIIYI